MRSLLSSPLFPVWFGACFTSSATIDRSKFLVRLALVAFYRLVQNGIWWFPLLLFSFLFPQGE